MKKRAVWAFLGSVAVGASVMMAAPANAGHVWPWNTNVNVETNVGVEISPPNTSGMKCSWGKRATVCFKQYGDVWYVRDEIVDGHSAVAIWEDWDGSEVYRQGLCRNPHGAFSWAKCNKNYWEDHTIRFSAGYSEGWHVLDYHDFRDVGAG